jgi:hypothetical protein
VTERRRVGGLAHATSHPRATTEGVTEPPPSGELGLRVFTYAVVVEKAGLYVAVVDALVAAKERFTLQLRPGELVQQLPEVTVGEIADALEALEGWGNVTKFYDTAAPETLDEFYAKRFLHQLTEAGVVAVRRVSSRQLGGVLVQAV